MTGTDSWSSLPHKSANTIKTSDISRSFSISSNTSYSLSPCVVRKSNSNSRSHSVSQDGRGEGEKDRDRDMKTEGEKSGDGEGDDKVEAGQKGEEEDEEEEEVDEDEEQGKEGEDAKSVMEDLVASYFTTMSRRGSPIISCSKHYGHGQSPMISYSGRHQPRLNSSNSSSSVNSNMNSVMNSYINSVMHSNMNSNMNSVMHSNINSVMNSNMNSVMHSTMNSNMGSVTNSQEYGVTSVAADTRWSKQSIVLSKPSTPRSSSPCLRVQLPSPYVVKDRDRAGEKAGAGAEWDGPPVTSLTQQGNYSYNYSNHVVAFTNQQEGKTIKTFSPSAPPLSYPPPLPLLPPLPPPHPLPYSLPYSLPHSLPHAPRSLAHPFETEKWSPMVQLSLSPMPVSLLALML